MDTRAAPETHTLEARRGKKAVQGAGAFKSYLYWLYMSRKGGKGNNGGNTFAKVPVLGNLLEQDYIPRS
jgi:hypothetical protein